MGETDIATGKGLGLLDDPLADWVNDDLLFGAESRRRLKLDHPLVLPILDWPEVRSLFARHDTIAEAARKQCHRFGLTAFAIGFTGLMMFASSPILHFVFDGGERAVHIAAEILIAFGGSLGILHWIKAPSRQIWLANRYWTERLRQFYFQFIVNNLDLAARAMTDPAALTQWQTQRAAKLAEFSHGIMNDVTTRIQKMTRDRANMLVWIFEDWAKNTAKLPQPSGSTDELMQVLHRQRIGIQIDYSEKKIRNALKSPRFLSSGLEITSNLLTITIMLIALIAGGLLIAGNDTSAVPLQILFSLAAICSACVLGMRVINEGLQLHIDAERYDWYCAAVEAVDNQFSHADLPGKIEALRDLECHAYQELRRFTDAHLRARFLL